MEWAWSVEVRATRRFPFDLASRLARESVRCYPRRSRKLSTDYVRWLPRARRTESAGCGGQPRLEHPTPGIGLLHLGGSVSAVHPARQVSRGSVARQCARCGCCSGRGRRRQAEYVGDDGLGGRATSLANSAGRSTLRWRAVRTTLARILLGVGALAGAVAAAHLADDDGGPDSLFGAPVGGVDRRVPQEREEGAEFAGQVGRRSTRRRRAAAGCRSAG